LNEPTHIDLFSGIGGFALAARRVGFRTTAFCEIDPYCQKVLAKNFLADTESERESPESSGTREGILQSAGNSRVRIYSNIFDFDGTAYRGASLLTGGFPCQPFSVAGKRRGAADDRHLWPEMLRVIKEARPAFVLGENVPGVIPMELDNVLSDLESIGYAARPFVIPACAVDARHRRDRLWIIGRNVADSKQPGLERQSGIVDVWSEESGWNGTKQGGSACPESICAARRTEWLPEPDVGRVAHGIPARVDRLRGLGNAIVPQVAFEILKEIRKLI
jgi:DNA (cytosine-5)-methyltransferase 1